MSGPPDLYEYLTRMAYASGPVIADFCRCLHCDEVEFVAVPLVRGFESLECSYCGDLALDQLEIPA
jgi:hypothetical protein